MERVLGGTDKIILDSTGGASGGVVFYISLNELMKLGNPSGQQPSHPKRTQAGVNR